MSIRKRKKMVVIGIGLIAAVLFIQIYLQNGQNNEAVDEFLPPKLLELKEINHEYFMVQAIKEAIKGAEKGEFPVGAVLVNNGKIIARGHNTQQLNNDPAGHAEINIIREACQRNQSRYLRKDYILYTTMEPCPMCVTALVEAGIPVVVYGAKGVWGALGTRINLIEVMGWHKHGKIEILSGILDAYCDYEKIRKYVQNNKKKVN